MRECCLAAALLMAFPIAGKAAMASKAFRARASLNKAQAITRHLTHSDTIPLTSRNAVYALSIDATIQQPREASFVRIVLEDTEGHNYLVAESDRFRNDTTTVQLSQYCEETALLGGITPACLKCYLAGGATLTLTGIHISDEEPMRLQSTSEETAKAIKEAQVQDIVDRINEYNISHGKLWRAGLNNWALAEHGTEALGEEDAYTANFKYYTDGIYEMGERPIQAATYQSPYVDSFDWRDRHGKNWITDIRNQGTSGCCHAFATTGMVEAVTNTYFNRHLNYDLSEQCLLNYPIYPNYYSDIHYQCMYIEQNGIIDEYSYPFTGEICNSSQPRPNGLKNVSFETHSTLYTNNYTSDQFYEQLKYYLIHNGPGAWGYNYHTPEYVYNVPNYYHCMTLVGYGKVTANDYYTYVDTTTYNTSFPSNNIIGQTYWILKDSYGTETNYIYHHNGFRYVVFHDYSKVRNAYFITSPITIQNYSASNIVVEDTDGDGYFNWGIGPRPDDRLPAWAEQEEDGDDSNRLKGTMDEYGNLESLSYNSSVIIIDHDMTDTELIDTYNNGSRFFRRGIKLNAGVTLTLQGALAFYSEKFIYMNNNSNLVIDGGTLVDARLYSSTSGGKVTIQNGGQILCHKRSEFSLPTGISLDLIDGKIME